MTPTQPLQQLSNDFQAALPDLEQALQGQAEPLRRLRETAGQLARDAQAAQLNTLVFGPYNAGKSTFINALLGQELAPMGDVPLTAHITAYEWQGHLLHDSPGIDAPIEHEAVTDDFIERQCHAVIYLVPTGGALEEAATWQRLCRFISQKKAVMVVVNDRHGHELNGVEFAELRATIYANMQAAARQQGLDDPLDQLDVLHVKARTALKARLEGKPGLLQQTGLPQLEEVLSLFLESSTAKILAADQQRAGTVVQEAIQSLWTQAGSEAGQRIQACRTEIEAERRRLESALVHALRAQADKEIDTLAGTVGDLARDPADPQARLTRAFELAHQRLSQCAERQLGIELERAEALVREATQRLNQELTLASVGLQDVASRTPLAGQAPSLEELGEDGVAKALKQARELPVRDWTEQGVKALLKQGKEWFPEFFKGIGPKTMGKWAGYVGKGVGPLLLLAQSGYQLHQANQEEKRAREQHSRYVAGVMSGVKQAFQSALGEYDLMFRKVAQAALAPALQALDRLAQEVKTSDAAQAALRERLQELARELER